MTKLRVELKVHLTRVDVEKPPSPWKFEIALVTTGAQSLNPDELEHALFQLFVKGAPIHVTLEE